jgi:hypothetical protein
MYTFVYMVRHPQRHIYNTLIYTSLDILMYHMVPTLARLGFFEIFGKKWEKVVNIGNMLRF